MTCSHEGILGKGTSCFRVYHKCDERSNRAVHSADSMSLIAPIHHDVAIANILVPAPSVSI